jgi:hypothetical protein
VARVGAQKTVLSLHCHTVVTLLLHCCCTVVTLLIHGDGDGMAGVGAQEAVETHGYRYSPTP